MKMIPKTLLDRLDAVEAGKADSSPLVLFEQAGDGLAAGDRTKADKADAQGRLVVVISRFGEQRA